MARTCLIVDDSRIVRKIARKIIEDFGFECNEVEDGSQAQQICAETMPEVILLDWIMPVMSGIEFLKMLRKMPGGTTPKVIFCTTESNLKHIMTALDAGADEYIMKPFDGEIIHTKFEQTGLL